MQRPVCGVCVPLFVNVLSHLPGCRLPRLCVIALLCRLHCCVGCRYISQSWSVPLPSCRMHWAFPHIAALPTEQHVSMPCYCIAQSRLLVTALSRLFVIALLCVGVSCICIFHLVSLVSLVSAHISTFLRIAASVLQAYALMRCAPV